MIAKALAHVMRLFNDERGNLSMARTLLVSDMIVGVSMIAVDTFSGFLVPNEGYILVGGMWPMLAVWAAGPRMAQYLSPVAKSAVGAITGALAKAAQKYGGHSPGYSRPVGIIIDSDPDWQEGDES